LAVIAEQFPEAKSGDFPPDAEFALALEHCESVTDSQLIALASAYPEPIPPQKYFSHSNLFCYDV
jgi:hypothetical protein